MTENNVQTTQDTPVVDPQNAPAVETPTPAVDTPSMVDLIDKAPESMPELGLLSSLTFDVNTDKKNSKKSKGLFVAVLKDGGLLGKSKGGLYFMRLIQRMPFINEAGFPEVKQFSTLIKHTDVELLQMTAGIWNDEGKISGRIVTTHKTEGKLVAEGKDLTKLKGDLLRFGAEDAPTCKVGGENLYAFYSYDATGVKADTIIEHDNAEEGRHYRALVANRKAGGSRPADDIMSTLGN
jgi:hypothetical protein